MTQTLVALDIETTGLDSNNDKIIEIGAVRFSGSEIKAEFESLINPGIRIPPFITQLTGISDAMVRGNKIPMVEEALDQLINFVGDTPVIGHNVKFDLGFIRSRGALKKNPEIDTYEMAAVILPAEGRYNLRALGQSLAVPMKATHRALDDTKVTQAIYFRMFQMIQELPNSLLAEIVRLAKNTKWQGYLPFMWALQEQQKNIQKSDHHPYQNPLLSLPPHQESDPLQPKSSIKGLDLEEVSSILEPGGPFHKSFPDYENRSEQIEMLI